MPPPCSDLVADRSCHACIALQAWTSLRLLAICLFFAALVGIALGALPTPTGRTTLVGVVGVVVTTAMYAAPLSVVSMVIRTRSVEFMPFYLSVNGFVNAVVWLGQPRTPQLTGLAYT